MKVEKTTVESHVSNLQLIVNRTNLFTRIFNRMFNNPLKIALTNFSIH